MRRMRVVAALVSLLALLTVAWPSSSAALGGEDPARIEGTWMYRTRSNCGTVEGVGKLWLGWDPARQHYAERGMVHWADSGLTITWWGSARVDGSRRRLRARVDNSLGDRVESTWTIHGDPPERLELRWSQTNGCHGVGIATRPAARAARRAAR